MKEKIIFTNGLIDLAQTKIRYKKLYIKLMIFLHQPIELLILQNQYLRLVYLINMESGWMDGSLEERELRDMIL
jgi:hypothetical protein